MKTLSSIFSFFGNPIIMVPVMIQLVLYRRNSSDQHLLISIISIGLSLFAIGWILYEKKIGHYSDFSVSNRKQRYSLYYFAIPAVFGVAVISYVLELPSFFITSFIAGGVLLIASYLSNFVIKSSLHTSVNIYLSIVVFTLDLPLGLLVFFLTIVIAISRVILKKHTVPEVISGFLIGTICGSCLYFYTIY
ncbi:MAG: hypothetical protein AAFQ94_24265 [Bacteroidota bacterium]